MTAAFRKETAASASPLKPAVAGACVMTVAAAAAAFLALRPSAPADTAGMAASPSIAPAARSSAVRQAPGSSRAALLSSTAAPDAASSEDRRHSDEDRRLSAPPEGATKVSVRPLASSSSPAAALPAAGAPASGHPSGGAISRRASGHESSSLAGNQGRVSAALGSPSSTPAEAARIARSAASLPLSHNVTDDQARQAAPNVPQETLDHLRDQFEQSAGVGQLDPSDSEYARRWDSAQRETADQMRSLYGWGAYAELQRQAALASASGQPGH